MTSGMSLMAFRNNPDARLKYVECSGSETLYRFKKKLREGDEKRSKYYFEGGAVNPVYERIKKRRSEIWKQGQGTGVMGLRNYDMED